MGVFAAAGYADNRFCLEGYVEAVFAEYFTDDDAGFQFVVCCLQGVHRESPVQFQLFANVYGVAGVVNFRFDPAHFFVAHFHAHAAGVQFFDGFFHGGTDVAAHSLPVLFLQSLGNGEVLDGFFFTGGLNPEFQFRADGEFNVSDVIEGYVFHAFDFPAASEEAFQLGSYEGTGVFQNGAGVDEFAVVEEEAWNAKGTYGTAIIVNIVFVVVDVPVHGGVGHHIYPGIVQGSDVHEDYGGAVGLYSGAGEEVVVVLEEQFNRYLFIGIVACQVDAYQGYEADFRMGSEKCQYAFFAKFTGGNVIQ